MSATTPKLFCLECKALEKKSKVYVKTKTIVGQRDVFFDEEGNKHIHDKSYVEIYYMCSNGHMWQVESYGKCMNPQCGWSGENKSA